MKKIKIMLLSFIVLAIVGGTLAFKAKEDNFCIYRKNLSTCALVAIVETYEITTSPGVPAIYTTLAMTEDCPSTTAPCPLRIIDMVED